MTLLERFARVLGRKPEEVASSLGLEPGAEDKAMAEALMRAAAKAVELEAKPRPVVSEAIADMFGADPGDALGIKIAILKMQLEGSLGAVRANLGLAGDAGVRDVLNAVGSLQETHRGLLEARKQRLAEELVDDAVRAGKILPEARGIYLDAIVNDFEATHDLIATMPIITAATSRPNSSDPVGLRALTPEEKHVCGVLGISKETFLASA